MGFKTYAPGIFSGYALGPEGCKAWTECGNATFESYVWGSVLVSFTPALCRWSSGTHGCRLALVLPTESDILIYRTYIYYIMNTKKANQILTEIAAEFAGNASIPKYMAAAFIRAPEIPCSKWSFGNQLLMQVGGETDDARGYHQWNKIGRHVRKGASARYILAPMTVKREDKDGEERTIMVGFRSVPVFAIEDTDGEPVEEYKPTTLPPLADLAEISYRNSGHGESGSFNPRTKKITLSTEEPSVYFHELVHKYDGRTHELKGGQDPEQEIVAELGACVLARMYGVEKSAVNHMAYIAGYAKAKTPAEVGVSCMRMADRVMQAIRLILADAAKLS